MNFKKIFVYDRVVAGLMPYSIQGGKSDVTDFNELKTGGLWTITSEVNRPDPLYKFWIVDVSVGKDGSILQQAKVNAGGIAGIFSRIYRSDNNDWTPWTQSFGYNSLAELSNGINPFLFEGQGFKSYTYPEDVDNIKTMAVAMVNENWVSNPLTSYGKYGLLFSIGVPYEGKFNGMCIQILISAVSSASQTYVRTCWNGTWASWVSLV